MVRPVESMMVTRSNKNASEVAGESIAIQNRVIGVGDGLVPPDLVAIPPGASLVEIRTFGGHTFVCSVFYDWWMRSGGWKVVFYTG